MVSSQTGTLTRLKNNHPWVFCSQDYFTTSTGSNRSKWPGLGQARNKSFICQYLPKLSLQAFKIWWAHFYICCHRRKISHFSHAVASGCTNPWAIQVSTGSSAELIQQNTASRNDSLSGGFSWFFSFSLVIKTSITLQNRPVHTYYGYLEVTSPTTPLGNNKPSHWLSLSLCEFALCLSSSAKHW